VTHDPRIAAYAGRLVLMKDGKVVDDLKLDGSGDAAREAMERAGLL
jgi:putative ABC transport system ATP-binding protein